MVYGLFPILEVVLLRPLTEAGGMLHLSPLTFCFFTAACLRPLLRLLQKVGAKPLHPLHIYLEVLQIIFTRLQDQNETSFL